MKRVLNYIPFHVLCCFIIGICLQHYYALINDSLLFFAALILLLISTLLFFYWTNNRVLFTCSSAFIFIFFGLFNVYLTDDRQRDHYYQNHTTTNNITVLKIKKVLKASPYHYKFIAAVLQVNQQRTVGKVLINVKKDTSAIDFNIDDELLLKANFEAFHKPLNPHQFNYPNYLARQGIYQQVYVKREEVQKQKRVTPTLFGIAQNFRKKILQGLQHYQFAEDEFAVLSALVLGQRQQVSKELSQNYANAGVLHILAVSGLHVGIILLMLLQLFKPIAHFKYGKPISTMAIILILWFFAFLSGLSASVVRAVTMYTFVAFGAVYTSKKIIEFSLVSSALFLLLVQPLFLFEVGFQLSYLAVFGIIWIQPKLYSYLKTKWKISNYVAQLITVSLAAQLAVLPLSLCYFHQFPGLFLWSNIIIIPFLKLILLGGIIVVMGSLVVVLPRFLTDFYESVLALLNRFIHFVAQQESFLFQEVSMSFSMMLAWYLLFILVFRFLIKQTPKQLIFLLLGCIGWQTIQIIESHFTQQQASFIVFHESRASVLAKRIGSQLTVFSERDTLPNLITNYKIGERVVVCHQQKIPNYLTMGTRQVLIVDSLGVFKVNNLEHPIVILRNSPKINLNRLVQTLKPPLIIADGSNYKSDVATWKSICKNNNIGFKYTGAVGAVILD